MSTGKRFDKTFTRKKRDTPKNNNEVREEEQLLTTTAPQQNGKSENLTKISGKKGEQQSTNNKNKIDPKPKEEDKNNNNNNNKEKKKKKKEKNEKGEELKETQKKKRKLENGVEEKGEKDVVLSKLKKPKASKSGEKASKNQSKEKERKKEVKGESFECAFPTNRISRIVKSEGSSDYKLSGEAVFLINKATEKFIELFSSDAYDSAVEDHKSFVGYKHLASAVCKKKHFDFLADFVPEKVTAEKALAERKPVETPFAS